MPRLVKGSLVRFRIGDVFYPGVMEVLRQVNPETEVCGRLLFFSDAGRKPAQYAVIDVQDMGAPVIVPVDRLRGVPPGGLVRGEVTATAPPEE